MPVSVWGVVRGATGLGCYRRETVRVNGENPVLDPNQFEVHRGEVRPGVELAWIREGVGGIPLLLLVPFALVAMLVGLLLGFAGAGCAVGELVGRRSSSSAQTLLVSLVVGLAVIWGLTVIARVAGLSGLPIRMLVGIVLFAGFLIEYLALTVGFGAVILSRFGRRGGPRDTTFASPPPVPGYGSGPAGTASL